MLYCYITLPNAGRGWVSGGWVRTQRRMGGWLALLTLALQLTLCFGHVHVAALTGTGLTVVTPHDHGQPGADDEPDDCCPLCVVLALLSGAQIAAAPIVLLPIEFAASERVTFDETARARSTRAAFRSRAPPLA